MNEIGPQESQSAPEQEAQALADGAILAAVSANHFHSLTPDQQVRYAILIGLDHDETFTQHAD